jgi:site-specific recombinase XerD
MQTPTTTHLSFETALAAFVRSLQAKNRGQATIKAYTADLGHFFAWLTQTNPLFEAVDEVQQSDIIDYLAALGRRGLSGVSRARKLAAIRELFRYLEGADQIGKSPAIGVETPKKERTSRAYLLPDEYSKMLSLAGGTPRDYAILQVFLQTGIRVSELCNLRCDDVDLKNRTLTVTAGKGMVARTIELEKKGAQAIKSWLAVRPQVVDDHLFLNQYGEPIGERGVQKLVTKYHRAAGITKRIGCHSFRHTFGTLKAQKGVSPFQIRDWLGHANLNTTQIYVHMARQDAKKVMEASSL